MSGAELSILGALWVQGALTIVLLFVLGRRRVPLVTENKIAIKDIALDSSGWPEDAQKASNAFNNQFQLPVLWAIGLGMALYLGAGWLEAILAWGFVSTRIVHAAIHVTSNHVMRRFAAYVAGFAVLAILWLVLLGRIITMAVA
ncbi:MAPEG family protein [Pelagibacterium montanilacus]|uniref:MAPEG family protein n=1 Tax=Pelagibacterium montanilacus TaxID=2185280 RepID=UPI0013E0A830|nr:MAPEG family protein [Pelagibacterium montanilacus]